MYDTVAYGNKLVLVMLHCVGDCRLRASSRYAVRVHDPADAYLSQLHGRMKRKKDTEIKMKRRKMSTLTLSKKI